MNGGDIFFLFCKIENRVCALANVYLPPPFDVSILCELTKFVLDKPGVQVVVTGDFIMVMDWKLDRFAPGTQMGSATDSRLPDFLEETGLRDIWRIRNLEV